MNLVPCQGKHGQVASVLYPLMIFIFSWQEAELD